MDQELQDRVRMGDALFRLARLSDEALPVLPVRTQLEIWADIAIPASRLQARHQWSPETQLVTGTAVRRLLKGIPEDTFRIPEYGAAARALGKTLQQSPSLSGLQASWTGLDLRQRCEALGRIHLLHSAVWDFRASPLVRLDEAPSQFGVYQIEYRHTLPPFSRVFVEGGRPGLRDRIEVNQNRLAQTDQFDQAVLQLLFASADTYLRDLSRGVSDFEPKCADPIAAARSAFNLEALSNISWRLDDYKSFVASPRASFRRAFACGVIEGMNAKIQRPSDGLLFDPLHLKRTLDVLDDGAALRFLAARVLDLRGDADLGEVRGLPVRDKARLVSMAYREFLDESRESGTTLTSRALSTQVRIMDQVFDHWPLHEGFVGWSAAGETRFLEALAADPLVQIAARNWGGMKDEERHDVLRHVSRLQDTVFSTSDITFQPAQIEFKDLGPNKAHGSHNIASGLISINTNIEKCGSNFDRLLDTLLHETRHRHHDQMQRALDAGALSPESPLYSQAEEFNLYERSGGSDGRLYIHAHILNEQYRKQPVEQDASGFSARVRARFYEQLPVEVAATLRTGGLATALGAASRPRVALRGMLAWGLDKIRRPKRNLG